MVDWGGGGGGLWGQPGQYQSGNYAMPVADDPNLKSLALTDFLIYLIPYSSQSGRCLRFVDGGNP